MKFACDSCGKKYVLTDEKLVGKKNVRLRCRACDHVVIIKQDGELIISPIVGPSVRPPPSLAPDLMPSEFPRQDPGFVGSLEGGADDEAQKSAVRGDTSDGLAGPLASHFPSPVNDVPRRARQQGASEGTGAEAQAEPGKAGRSSRGERSTGMSRGQPGSATAERKPVSVGLVLTVLCIVLVAVLLTTNC